MGAEVVAAGRLKLGDRVAGGADGMEAFRPQSGAFAEYASVDGIMVFKLPEDMSFEIGAGMPLRIATSGMALFHSLQLPHSLLDKPAEEPFDVLVYGGATSTGTMAIQILKQCGLRVITTCSPRNFDLVRSYGADVCFDYNSSTCGPDIRAFTKDALDYALDCITEESTMKICYQALGRCGGKCEFSLSPSFPLSPPPHLPHLTPNRTYTHNPLNKTNPPLQTSDSSPTPPKPQPAAPCAPTGSSRPGCAASPSAGRSPSAPRPGSPNATSSRVPFSRTSTRCSRPGR